MCGIFGIIDYNRTLSDYDKKLIIRLLAVQNEDRGKDASGYCVLKDNKKLIHKCDSWGRYLDLQYLEGAQVIIGHTRQGTISGKTVEQAHPFTYQKYVLAHNGAGYVKHNKHTWAQGPSGVDSETMLRYLVATGGTTNENIKAFIDEWKSGSTFSFTILTDANEFVAFRETNPFHFVKLESGPIIYSSDDKHLRSVLDMLEGIVSFDLPKDVYTYKESEVLRVDTNGVMSITAWKPETTMAESAKSTSNTISIDGVTSLPVLNMHETTYKTLVKAGWKLVDNVLVQPSKLVTNKFRNIGGEVVSEGDLADIYRGFGGD